MNRDVVIVLTSALLATLNPSLLAAVAVMCLLPNPKRLMLGYLLGAYTTSIVSGLAIVYTLHGSATVRTSSRLLSPSGDIVVGAVALSIAFVLATGRDARLRSWKEHRKAVHASDGQAKEPWQTRTLERGSAVITFAVGAAMSFPGVSYANALDHIAHLNPPTVSILLLIGYFCVMQQILLEGALLASTFAPDWTQDVTVRLKAWFARHGRQIAMIGLSGIGTLLAARGLVGIA
jgi:Sap, sulfolipid-1-addressing protein